MDQHKWILLIPSTFKWLTHTHCPSWQAKLFKSSYNREMYEWNLTAHFRCVPNASWLKWKLNHFYRPMQTNFWYISHLTSSIVGYFKFYDATHFTNSETWHNTAHYSDVIVNAIESQITGISMVRPTASSGANQRNIKTPLCWPLWGEYTGHRWFPHIKSQ